MKRKINCGRLSLLLFVLLINQPVIAQNRNSRIDSLLTTLANHHLFNGSVLVAEDGRIIYKKSIGYLDAAHRIPNSDTTHFNLASLSKPFTAIAVLQLVQKGKIKLDDVCAKYLPDFPYPTVTIKHLLNHTSGLPVLERYEADYIKAHPDEPVSNESAYAQLVQLKLPLYYQPGDNWGYNNANYMVLAMLVEKVSKMPFAAYLKKNIFLPANMPHTYLRSANMANTIRYTYTSMYTTTRQNVDSLDHHQYNTYYNLGAIYGPGNVISTLQDLFNFDNTLAAGKLINADLMKIAFTPVTLNNGKVFHQGSSTRSYGLGWSTYNNKTEPFTKFAFHDGHIVGLTTFLHRNLEKRQTIIFYDNTDNAPLQPMVSISNILNGLPPQKIEVRQSLVRVYGETLVNKGIDYAAVKFNELKSDTTNYYMDEMEMNHLGFDLLAAPSLQYKTYALEVFKLNTLLYPNSGNTYDSYADALERNGKKEEAIAMYRRSIVLWPGNEEGKKALLRLGVR